MDDRFWVEVTSRQYRRTRRFDLLKPSAQTLHARKLIDRLEAAILARAYHGDLMLHDPADEAAIAPFCQIPASRFRA